MLHSICDGWMVLTVSRPGHTRHKVVATMCLFSLDLVTCICFIPTDAVETSDASGTGISISAAEPPTKITITINCIWQQFSIFNILLYIVCTSYIVQEAARQWAFVALWHPTNEQPFTFIHSCVRHTFFLLLLFVGMRWKLRQRPFRHPLYSIAVTMRAHTRKCKIYI